MESMLIIAMLIILCGVIGVNTALICSCLGDIHNELKKFNDHIDWNE